jgi:nitrogen fixation/metabolism regulation signal transduction histidine kinase
MREKRKKIWIDRFQTYLSLRIAFYFILYQVAVWSLFAIERNLFAAMEETVGPAGVALCFFILVVSVLLLGILFILDAVKLTHRIVGPLYRFRKTIQALAAGEEVDPVTLRKDDFLQEMREDFNAMLRALEQRGVVVLKTPEAKKEQDKEQPVPA